MRCYVHLSFFFFSSRRRHTRLQGDWSSDVCSSDLADLIMVNTRELNLGVFSEPAHMLVEAAQPANVDTVMVDGRILKRRGRLTAIDVEQTVSEASSALAAVRKRAGWW